MAGTTTNFSWPYPTGPDVANVASDIQSLASAIDTTLGSAWTAYTPLWTADTVNPAVNNGTALGSYKRFAKTLLVCGAITMGNTTTFGTGSYRVSLPVGFLARTGGTTGASSNFGIATLYDDSTGFYNTGTVGVVSGNDNLIRIRSHGTANISPTVPFTWATNDIMAFRLVIELQ